MTVSTVMLKRLTNTLRGRLDILQGLLEVPKSLHYVSYLLQLPHLDNLQKKKTLCDNLSVFMSYLYLIEHGHSRLLAFWTWWHYKFSLAYKQLDVFIRKTWCLFSKLSICIIFTIVITILLHEVTLCAHATGSREDML